MKLFAVLRVMVMEYRFDRLRSHSPEQIRKAPRLQRSLLALADYYDNGQWQRDFTLDEAGLLPRWLKRGVLSEDGVYDLLCDLKAAEENP